MLSGIEHAFAQGFQRVSIIEKYENKIEVDENRENDDISLLNFRSLMA